MNATHPMTLEQAQQRLIDAGLILEDQGQGDFTRGHVSLRVPGDPAHFLMKPHSWGFGEITPENIVVCNLAGEKVSGGGRKHSEHACTEQTGEKGQARPRDSEREHQHGDPRPPRSLQQPS